MYRTVAILLAALFDLTFGDPPNRFHPLLLMGHWLNQGRQLAPQRYRFWFGAGWTLAGLILFSVPWWLLKKIEDKKSKISSPVSQIWFYSLLLTPYSLLPALLLKPVFAYRNLRKNVANVANALMADNLPAARQLAGHHLVSRDTGNLSAAEVAGAAIESLAENLTDSLTAPLLAYALGGLPAAWGYRFINTADAMWGYRTPEFEQLGKFAARLDDALNWLPARLTGWLLVLAAGLTGENSRQAAQTMLIQHNRTPSPNAGWTMSAMAGALDVTLSKRGVYLLAGGEAQPSAATIYRALRVADGGVALSTATIILCIAAYSRYRTFLKNRII